jgi:hypothetical protein
MTTPSRGSVEDTIRKDYSRPVILRLRQAQNARIPGFLADALRIGKLIGQSIYVPGHAWPELVVKYDAAKTLSDGNAAHPICLHGQRLIAEAVAGQEVFVSTADRAIRLGICHYCQFRKDRACLAAKCSMSRWIDVTSKYASETCPKGKWPNPAKSNSAPKA